MKIELTETEERNLINLKQNDLGLWMYTIKTLKGDVVSDKIKTKEVALKNAIRNLKIIFKSTIK